jgi:D-serine deaminase-like pyridoxal phosphate-dependent protein
MDFLRKDDQSSRVTGPLEPPVPVIALPTPALLVDRARLERNLAGMQELARRHGLRLRPHAKSHKCTALGRKQVEAGAIGLCTAKVSEAEVFAAAGFDDLLVAYPMVGAKAQALADLAERFPEARCAAAVDSLEGVSALAEAATRRDVILGVWLKVDTGLHRAGLPPDDLMLVDLGRAVRDAEGLRLVGLLTHAGHAYKAVPEEVARIGHDEGESMVRAAEHLFRAGLGRLQVSLGSTPTIRRAAAVEGVNEIHPGVYVFGDRQQTALRAMAPEDVSLSVLATVVSRPAPGRWVLDAGSKTLSNDRGAHGSETVRGFGEVRRLEAHAPVSRKQSMPFAAPVGKLHAYDPPILTRLSEEHGVLEDERDLGFVPGDLVEVVPNHACAAVNLAEVLYLTEGEGAERAAVEAWAIEARGRVH